VSLTCQVLRRKYGKEADLWSAGVILYILLSGVPPFWGETEQQIFDAILKGHVDFQSDPWPRISSQAKNCVRMLLTSVRGSVRHSAALDVQGPATTGTCDSRQCRWRQASIRCACWPHCLPISERSLLVVVRSHGDVCCDA